MDLAYTWCSRQQPAKSVLIFLVVIHPQQTQLCLFVLNERIKNLLRLGCAFLPDSRQVVYWPVAQEGQDATDTRLRDHKLVTISRLVQEPHQLHGLLVFASEILFRPGLAGKLGHL